MLTLPKIIGHRGVAGHAPENTLAGLRCARSLGLSWVELDVMLSRDGEVIVFHDHDLKRVCHEDKLIADLTYAELKQYDVGDWFSSEFLGETIPRLTDVIACLTECQLTANIELKPHPGQEIETVVRVLEILSAHWPTSLPPPLISSFDLESLYVARAADINLQLGLLLEHWRGDWIRLAKDLECVSIHLQQRILSKEIIQAIKKTDRLVLAYTVDDKQRAEELFALGVDAVFSDFPDKII